MAKESGLPRGIYEKVAGSKIYWIRYTDAGGTERREKCGNITAAKNRLSKRHTERSEGHQVHRFQKVSMSTLVKEALVYAKSESDPQHAKELGYKLKRIETDFESTPVYGITKTTILGWLDEQTEEHEWSPSTRNRYQAAWSLLFRIAIENKRIRENPASGIRRRREDNQRTRWLTPEEEPRLTNAIASIHSNYVDMYVLSLHVGMRKSELLRMKAIGDYDARTNLFRISQRKVRSLPEYRYVPATPLALAAYNRLSAGKQSGDPLCSRRRGELAELVDIRHWFDKCVVLAGLKDFHWHDLRHTFASRLVMRGRPLAEVMRYMGHQSIQMTMRYSHLMPDNHSGAVDTMMSFYAPTGTESATGTGSGTGTMKLVKK